MTVQIQSIEDERKFQKYIAARSAPLLTMVTGVHPNAHKALQQYDDLIALLGEGGELASLAAYHVNSVAAVSPFIAVMQSAMHVINKTMHTVNLLAVANSQAAPFSIPAEEPAVTVESYVATLQSAIATLTATLTAMAAMGGE